MNVITKDVLPVRDDNKIISILEILDIETGERFIQKEFEGVVIEAPNWLKTEKALIYNSQGKLWKFNLDDKSVTMIDTAHCIYCNNDHVLSPNHDHIAVSHHTKEDYSSRIYTIPLDGGMPVLVTPIAPSYLHGWSPDGTTLAYCAERNGQYDIYSIPASGGLEKQLTNLPGLDDGPEYSPDGSKIWFNSTRSGLMQIWNMNSDGSNPVHIVNEESNDWFPHVSPDGKKVSFVSYKKNDVEPGDHPANKHVELKIMNSDGTNLKTLVNLFGGQGTLNVNSWSPDSRQLAFVSYRWME